MSSLITAKMFMEFFEDNFNVEFIDANTKAPILEKIKAKEEADKVLDWKKEFDRREKEMDKIFAEMEERGEVL